MDEPIDTKNKIKHIFDTMGYGDDKENVTEATEWLKTKNNRLFAYIDKSSETPNGEILSLKNVNNDEALCDIYVPETATIEAIISKQGEAKNAWLEINAVKRVQIINNLGEQIQRSQDLFVQLEIVARGIHSNDTKHKALVLLTEYLRFYSSFSVKSNAKNSFKPQGLAVGIISDTNCLSSLGIFLGPCLAAGYNIILQTGPQLTLVASLLIDLSIQVGVPEGTIRLIPGNTDPKCFFTHPKVSVISIFDDLYKEKYFIGNHFGKKILNFQSSGIPMLVFDNCDLDSACHSVAGSSWSFKGVVPWSVRNIFVQENIFPNFIQKLKHRVAQISVNKSNIKNIDISLPDQATLDKLQTAIEKAKTGGVEVYQPNPNTLIPVLFIGGNIFNNNVIKADIDIPVVTVTAFRTIDEGVALANNTRQGLAASVWTENVSLFSEIIRTLKVGNIWLNAHGLFAADISTSPYKSSGNGYFGGKEGFYEYVHLRTLKNETPSQIQSGKAMENAIIDAKKGQESWYKTPRFDRSKNLQIIAQNIDANKTTWSLPEKWLDDWILTIHDYNSNNRGDNFAMKKCYNVMSFKEPHGVVAVEVLDDLETHNKRLVTAALIEGNSVIILNDSKATIPFYSAMSKLLPKGILTVVPFAQDAVKVAALHKELNIYFGEKGSIVFWTLPLKSSSKFKVVKLDDWNEVHDNVTLTKNIWFNVGQSAV